MCDKPMAPTAAETNDLFATARSMGQVFSLSLSLSLSRSFARSLSFSLALLLSRPRPVPLSLFPSLSLSLSFPLSLDHSRALSQVRRCRVEGVGYEVEKEEER